MSYLEIRYDGNEKVPYDEIFANYLVKEIFLKYLGRPPETLTELGSGTGKLSNIFSIKHNLIVTCIDKEKSPNLSEKILFHEHEIQNMDTTEIPPSDICFTKSVIEHVDDTQQFFRACEALTNDDGLIITLCPNWRTQWSNFYDDPTHVRPFNVIGLSTAAKICGLEVLHCEEFFQLPTVWRYPWLGRILQLSRIRLPTAIRNRYPILRFSYENMILLVARKVPS